MMCPNCKFIGQKRPMGLIHACMECGTAYPSRSLNSNLAEFLREHWDLRGTHPMYCRNSLGVRAVLHCSFCGHREAAAVSETGAPMQAQGDAA